MPHVSASKSNAATPAVSARIVISLLRSEKPPIAPHGAPAGGRMIPDAQRWRLVNLRRVFPTGCPDPAPPVHADAGSRLRGRRAS
jgi:hypothetical protein